MTIERATPAARRRLRPWIARPGGCPRLARRAALLLLARAGALMLTAGAAGAACFTEPARPTGLRIRMPDPDGSIPPLSGDEQEWLVGAVLPRPLVAYVSDERTFRPVPGARVVWRVATGAGEFLSNPEGRPLAEPVAVADDAGRARVRFRPTVPGVTTVSAAVVGREGRVITYSMLAMRDGPVQIRLRPWDDGFGCATWFQGPLPSGAVIVHARTPVEWALPYDAWGSAPESCESRIVSTSVPPGGQPFDSGMLRPGQAFRFTPNVAGTWEYQDVMGGGGGRLTVLEP